MLQTTNLKRDLQTDTSIVVRGEAEGSRVNLAGRIERAACIASLELSELLHIS